ncbi:MAG: galactose oxidase-like domain-containing protein [Chthoniobacterales bacterium]
MKAPCSSFVQRWYQPAGAALITALIVGLPLGNAQAQTAATEGLWTTLPYEVAINPVHVGLLHTGKVLVVAGTEAGAIEEPLAAVWDWQNGTFAVQTLLWDVFCSGMAAMPDGRILLAGGSTNYNPFYGEPRAAVFDPATEQFSQVESMAHGRFYATVTALGDGTVMTFSGLTEVGESNNAVEIYGVKSGWSAEYLAPWSPPNYPRMHLLPSGKVLYTGNTPSSNLFSPSTKAWTMDIATTVYGKRRKAGGSVLLPLRAENGFLPRVLIVGGNDPDLPTATNTAEIIDMSVRRPSWRAVAPMSLPRVQMNATILPTGKVLALGGSEVNEDPTTASLPADLFDPVTETWSSAGIATYPRLYHSVSLLLPDATVWVAGSNPDFGIYEEHMEIYSPAYLFTTDDGGNVVPAVRPVITSVTPEIGVKRTFSIQTPDSADISAVVLIRPGSPTHAFDQEQRLVGLSFSQSAPGTLTATAPPNGFIAPPGYYMVFILNQAGVPSVAKFVRLSSKPTNLPPDGTITSPVGDVAIQAGQSVDFASTATDPDGSVATYRWIFPEGTPSSSLEQNPGLVTFSEPGVYSVSMTAFDNVNVNDQSPPTRIITVQP